MFASTCVAQLGPCPAIANVNDLKVVLDAVYFDSAGAAQGGFPIERLTVKLQTQLNALRTGMGVVTEVVLCLERKPRALSDFTSTQIDQFNAARVVLEVWGTVASQPTLSSNSTRRRATVGFVVVPLRFYEFFNNPDVASRIPGVYSVDYTLRTASLASLLEQSNDFNAYLAVGIGLKLLREKSYDGAKKALCRAQYFIQPGADRPTDPGFVALLDYAHRMTVETVRTALASPKYTGPLRAIDPGIAEGCGR